jgi:hypothetical protein
MDILSLCVLIGVVALCVFARRASGTQLASGDDDAQKVGGGPAPFGIGRLSSATVSDSCRPNLKIDRKGDCYAQLYPITLPYVDYKTNHVPPEFAPAPCLGG